MNKTIALFALLSICSQASAFHQTSNSSSPPNRLAVRRDMSADDGLSTQLSQYQKREAIPHDRVFFIELGFGKIKIFTDGEWLSFEA